MDFASLQAWLSYVQGIQAHLQTTYLTGLSPTLINVESLADPKPALAAQGTSAAQLILNISRGVNVPWSQIQGYLEGLGTGGEVQANIPGVGPTTLNETYVLAAWMYQELDYVGNQIENGIVDSKVPSDLAAEIFGAIVLAFTGYGIAVDAGVVTGGAGAAVASSGSGVVPITTTVGAGSIPAVTTVAAGGAATGTVAAAAGTGATVASDVGTAVTDLTGSSTLGSIVQSVTGDLGSLVGDIESYLKPVTDLATNVLTGIQTLNTDIIQPLSSTVLKDYNTISGLVSEVDTLAHSGIQGILAIPSALSSAMTSIDAANQRLAQMNAQANQTIAQETLVPGIGGAIAAPLADLHKTLSEAFNRPIPNVGQVSQDALNESLVKTLDLLPKMNEILGTLEQVPYVGAALGALVKGISIIFAFLGASEHLIDAARQLGFVDFPVRPIDPADAVRAWWRGNLSEADARAEMQRTGLDPTRQKLLHDIQQWLPDAQLAVRMYLRGILPGDAFQAALAKQGYSGDDISALLEASLEPVSGREAILANGRISAGQAGFLPATLGEAVPQEFAALYAPRLQNPDIAALDWASHWRIPEMAWWITAYFRGIASQQEVQLAAQAHNIPPEVIPNLIAVEQENIQLWMIPDMIATGILTSDEGIKYLEYIGISPQSAQLILKYGQAKQKQAAGSDPLGLGKIAEANAKAMLEDGIITSAEYGEILTAHGYTPQAAALMADLAQQQLDLAARKNYAAGVVNQVLTGQTTIDDLKAMLGGEGFTSQEILSYVNQVQSKLAGKVKSPSETQVKAFWKHGLLADDLAVSALEQDGWSATWAQLFIDLWKAGG